MKNLSLEDIVMDKAVRERVNRNSEEWLREKEEWHKYAMELKKCRQEESTRGYLLVHGDDDYFVNQDGTVDFIK